MDKKAINSIRMVGVEMVSKANSGHPGIVLGATPMMYSLFTDNMVINAKDSKWINRDRFVLSAGHGSAMFYSMLHHAGFNIDIEDMKNFRKIDSTAAGHPEYGHVDGVDATTGPLGQGVAMGTGMAISEKFLNRKYPKIIDHYTYVLLGDGDLQDGCGKQALEFAGHYKLNKLIFLFDSNDVQLDTLTNKATSIDRKKYIESLNMEYHLIKDGENIKEINAAITKSKKSDRASFIEIKTIIGRGSPNAGTPAVHGSPIGPEDLKKVRDFYDNHNQLDIPTDIIEFVTNKIENRNKEVIQKWNKEFQNFKENKKEKYNDLMSVLNRTYKIPDLTKGLNKNDATRNSSGAIMNSLQDIVPNMIGGSADLSGSTKIKGKFGDFLDGANGNNINFGVKDFAISSLVNGMLLHGGVVPFGSTFFVFSDYSKPPIRLAALMKIPSMFIFSHDSVFVGEDGPTHQPIEHLTMFRALPNLNMFRPADEIEVVAAYKLAMESKTTPTVIATTRQNISSLENSSVEGALKGGYIVLKETGKLDSVIVASGAEVGLAIEAVKSMKNKNIRVVSMPSTDVFDKQSTKYQEDILPKSVFTLAIEAGATLTWHKYIKGNGDIIGIDKFGLSGPGKEIYEKYGFTIENIKNKLGGK